MFTIGNTLNCSYGGVGEEISVTGRAPPPSAPPQGLEKANPAGLQRPALCPQEGARSTPQYAGLWGSGKVPFQVVLGATKALQPGTSGPGSLPGSQLCQSLYPAGKERPLEKEGHQKIRLPALLRLSTHLHPKEEEDNAAYLGPRKEQR